MSSATQYLIRQGMFFLLQLYNIFFDRIFRDQFVDIDYVFLPDPVGTVCRLVLDCQVPPRIVVDHNIRRRQIQTGASGFPGRSEKPAVGLSSLLNSSTSFARFSFPVEPVSI